MKLVTLYTDGACEGNPGPGGWAAVLKYNDHVKEISGGVPVSTNNRMELQAAVEALRSLRERCEVRLFTDSQYVRTGISEWLDDWKMRGWKTKDKKPVKNAELWRELDKQASRHSVHWCWVKGHAGDNVNERCDLLARHEIMKVRQKISPTELKALLDEFQHQSQSVISAGTV